MAINVLPIPAGAMISMPNYNNGTSIGYPPGFNPEDSNWRYLMFKDMPDKNQPAADPTDRVIFIGYRKELRLYIEQINGKFWIMCNTPLSPSNFMQNGLSDLDHIWAAYWLTGYNLTNKLTGEPFFGYPLFDEYKSRTWGTGAIFTNDTYTDLIINHGTILVDYDVQFVPDGGFAPDAGGGNQNWGQGSPDTDTTGGNFNYTNDTVGMGEVNSTKTGIVFNNYYVVNRTELAEVKNKIWGITLPFLTKPAEAIISIMAYPTAIVDVLSTGGNFIKVGNTAIEISTGTVDYLAANALNTLTLGTVHLEPYFGGFQDYAPYTKIKVWLPFIGYRDLDPQLVQDKDIEIRYVVNYTNGSCIALIYSEGVLVYRHNGQLGQSIPLTQVNNGLIEATASTAIQSAALAAVNPVLGLASAVKGAESALSNVVNSRPGISSSAGGGGEAEWSLPLECFLIIERPDCAIAQTYNHEKGRPSLVNKSLSNCKGFTSMVDPKVTASCTQVENDRINSMLKEGVIING